MQVSDYGDVDKKEDFQFIYPYSPIHNVPEYKKGFKGQYPAVMLTTGTFLAPASCLEDIVYPINSSAPAFMLTSQAGNDA